MLTQPQLQQATTVLPFLGPSSSPLALACAQHAALMRIRAGTTVFAEGDVCSALSILVAGRVRVFKIGETGREITLYRFGRGESCILTANCILSRQQFPAIAVVEHDVEALVIPQQIFHEWINTFQPWRDYVFTLLSQRLATVMAVVDEVAFRRMDARIAEFLLRQAPTEHIVLKLTHQQVASELGTSREVISRILEDFADSGLVEIARGMVTILNREGLIARTITR